MRSISITHSFLTALAGAALIAGAQPSTALAAEDIKLTGCLVKAEGNDGYLVTNTPTEPAMVGTSGRAASPDAFGGVANFNAVIYWLDNDHDLAPHVGHRVEVEGDLKGDIKDGEIKLDRKDNWTELQIKADGREMKANVPNTSVVPGKDGKSHVLVRRVDVGKVKMLDAACN